MCVCVCVCVCTCPCLVERRLNQARCTDIDVVWMQKKKIPSPTQCMCYTNWISCCNMLQILHDGHCVLHRRTFAVNAITATDVDLFL